MPHYVYILYSEKRDGYYIGSCAEPESRLRKHNTSHKGYTSTGQPWVLAHTEEYNTKTEALVREHQLKKWKNKDRIRRLIHKSS